MAKRDLHARILNQLERERRRELRARLVELRELIAKARAERAESVKAVKLDCAAKRKELSRTCRQREQDARAPARSLADERSRKRGELRNTVPAYKRRAGQRAAERRAESDDEVRRNLAPEMVPVFDRVRRFIKGGPRRSRTEAFLEWAEENPEELYAHQQRDTDRYLAQLLAEEERTARELSPGRKRRKLSDVPF